MSRWEITHVMRNTKLGWWGERMGSAELTAYILWHTHASRKSAKKDGQQIPSPGCLKILVSLFLKSCVVIIDLNRFFETLRMNSQPTGFS